MYDLGTHASCRESNAIVSELSAFPVKNRWKNMAEREKESTSLIKVRDDRVPLGGGVLDTMRGNLSSMYQEELMGEETSPAAEMERSEV
jgi:hypothetical protein